MSRTGDHQSYGQKILDIAVYLPENHLSNEDLAKIFPDWPAEKILEKTGISQRHIAAQHETASDMACRAAQALFLQGKCGPSEVDFLIFCTQAPDYFLPTSACIIQDKLGIPKTAGALDINLGCSGFVYGLSLAKGLIASGSAKKVLLLTADTYSKYIHPLDKSVRTLFGDAAAATMIVESEPETFIGPFVFGTDGSGADKLIVKDGGFRSPLNENSSIEAEDSSGNIRASKNLYMNGPDVMAFSLKEVPRAISALLSKTNLDRDAIDFYILHQANQFMLEALRKKLKIPADKLPIYVKDCGNTVSSTIPLTMFKMIQDGSLVHGSKLMLVGFGVGFSWAACLVDY